MINCVKFRFVSISKHCLQYENHLYFTIWIYLKEYIYLLLKAIICMRMAIRKMLVRKALLLKVRFCDTCSLKQYKNHFFLALLIEESY